MSTQAITQAIKQTPSKAPLMLSIGLWSAQLLLAAMFGMAGSMKLLTPIETLAQSLPWVATAPVLLIKFIGLSEVAGALGVVLPALTRIKPLLTPLAGAGLASIMLLASLFHISRGEFSALGINFFLGALALFVAWGRSRKAPITSR